jgi:hypothetical protein
MSWATETIATLEKTGKAVCTPRGNSMSPLVKSGETVHLKSIDAKTRLVKGDVVLCRYGAKHYLHLIMKVALNKRKEIYLIGNNHGRQNGWVERELIYGIKVDAPDD